jgi:hypothetical protein
LIAVLAYDRGGRLEADADAALLIDIDTLDCDPPHHVFGRQHGTLDPISPAPS